MYEKQIEQIFCSTYNYSENVKRGTIFFCTESSVTFDKLLELSELLGTKAIDFYAGDASGGCPTCGPSKYYTIDVSGVDFERLP